MQEHQFVDNPMLRRSNQSRLGMPPVAPSALRSPPSLMDFSLPYTSTFKNFFSRSFQQLSSIAPQIHITNNTKRIKPAFTYANHKDGANVYNMAYAARRSTHKRSDYEPIIHYNGRCDTLDQLPDEKLEWIRHEPTTADPLQHPMMGHAGSSIVLKKPITRGQSFANEEKSPLHRPKAMFYIRVLQIIHQNVTKPHRFRCSVQVGPQICMSTLATSEKSGKHSIQVNVDETFLFDVDEDCTAVLKVYATPRSPMERLFSSPQETCVGRHEFNISVHACEKQVQRISLAETPGCQLVIVRGTYMSIGAQVMLENRQIQTGYITVNVRSKHLSGWNRYWATLQGATLSLYDFEYKESRPPLAQIPLKHFIEAFRPEPDDDEHQVDVGPLSLVLQFSRKVLNKQALDQWDDAHPIACRMYVLFDTLRDARAWEAAFAQVGQFLDELRPSEYDSDDSEYDYDDDDIYNGHEDANSIGSSSMDDASLNSCLSDYPSEQGDDLDYCNPTLLYGSTGQMQTSRHQEDTVPFKFLW